MNLYKIMAPQNYGTNMREKRLCKSALHQEAGISQYTVQTFNATFTQSFTKYIHNYRATNSTTRLFKCPVVKTSIPRYFKNAPETIFPSSDKRLFCPGFKFISRTR